MKMIALLGLALAACGGVPGAPGDASDEVAADASARDVDAGQDPRITNALGTWGLLVDLSDCGAPDRPVTFRVAQVDDLTTLAMVEPSAMVGAGVVLEIAGGRVHLELAGGETLAIQLRDDVVSDNPRAIVTWSAPGCETRGEADVVERVR